MRRLAFMATVVLIGLGVAVAIALIKMARDDRSGALDDVGPMPGLGRSDKGDRETHGHRS